MCGVEGSGFWGFESHIAWYEGCSKGPCPSVVLGGDHLRNRLHKSVEKERLKGQHFSAKVGGFFSRSKFRTSPLYDEDTLILSMMRTH